MSNALALRAGNLLDHGEKASCTASRATGRDGSVEDGPARPDAVRSGAISQRGWSSWRSNAMGL